MKTSLTITQLTSCPSFPLIFPHFSTSFLLHSFPKQNKPLTNKFCKSISVTPTSIICGIIQPLLFTGQVPCIHVQEINLRLRTGLDKEGSPVILLHVKVILGQNITVILSNKLLPKKQTSFLRYMSHKKKAEFFWPQGVLYCLILGTIDHGPAFGPLQIDTKSMNLS